MWLSAPDIIYIPKEPEHSTLSKFNSNSIKIMKPPTWRLDSQAVFGHEFTLLHRGDYADQ